MSLVVEDISGVAGHPAAGVTVTATGVVTVTRTVVGVTTPVRTGRSITVSGEDFVEDHEVPVGVPVTYAAALSTGEVVGTATITIHSSSAWLSDPLDWTSGVEVTLGPGVDGSLPLLTAGSLRSVKLAGQGTSVLPMGSRLPVRLGAARTSPEGVTVVVTSFDQAQAEALRSLAEQAPVVLLRVQTDPLTAMAGAAYVAGDITGQHVGGEITQWTLTGPVVAAPALPVQVVRFVYDAVLAATGSLTYDAVRAMQSPATYAAVKRNPLTGIN